MFSLYNTLKTHFRLAALFFCILFLSSHCVYAQDAPSVNTNEEIDWDDSENWDELENWAETQTKKTIDDTDEYLKTLPIAEESSLKFDPTKSIKMTPESQKAVETAVETPVVKPAVVSERAKESIQSSGKSEPALSFPAMKKPVATSVIQSQGAPEVAEPLEAIETATFGRLEEETVSAVSARARVPQISIPEADDEIDRAMTEAIEEVAKPASLGARVSRRVKKPALKKESMEPPKENLFAETFYLNTEQKLRYQTSEVSSFVVVETPGAGGKSSYAMVTDFGGNVVRSKQIPFDDLMAYKSWLKENTESAEFEGVEVRKVIFENGSGVSREYFFVGHKSFNSHEKAFAEIATIKRAVEAEGGNFQELVNEAQKYAFVDRGEFVEPGGERDPIEVGRPGDFIPQEGLILKMFDALSIGDKYFGPFQGQEAGEAFIWQSFGESTWRNTNLSDHDFNEQVGFWTNRLVLKGIRAPLNTVDVFFEATSALESDGIDFKDFLKLFAGLEWRPLARNDFLANYRPWSLNLLEWIRNYRFFVMYGDRKPLKDEIDNSADHDLIWGVQIFYEWGIDLPIASEGEPETIPDYLREYIWGEYFGNYRVETTNFGSEDDFDAVLLESSIILGFRLPGIPLPRNPINDELVLMPYFRYTHVSNTELSFPFQNSHFVHAGVRWMPFRNYRYKENEWLSKMKIFGEYVGVGKAQHFKQDGEAPNAVRTDWRVGINFSSRRF